MVLAILRAAAGKAGRRNRHTDVRKQGGMSSAANRKHLTRRPAKLASTEQVQVEVEDGLAGVRTDVVDRAVAVIEAALARQFRRDQVRVADNAGILVSGFFQSSDVLFRHDQDMGGRARIDVFERENGLVFIYLFRG